MSYSQTDKHREREIHDELPGFHHGATDQEIERGHEIGRRNREALKRRSASEPVREHREREIHDEDDVEDARKEREGERREAASLSKCCENCGHLRPLMRAYGLDVCAECLPEAERWRESYEEGAASADGAEEAARALGAGLMSRLLVLRDLDLAEKIRRAADLVGGTDEQMLEVAVASYFRDLFDCTTDRTLPELLYSSVQELQEENEGGFGEAGGDWPAEAPP
jgi:hypothetical protein